MTIFKFSYDPLGGKTESKSFSKGRLQKKTVKRVTLSLKVGRRPKTKSYLRKKIATWRVGTKVNFVRKYMVFLKNGS